MLQENGPNVVVASVKNNAGHQRSAESEYVAGAILCSYSRHDLDNIKMPPVFKFLSQKYRKPHSGIGKQSIDGDFQRACYTDFSKVLGSAKTGL
jgi:hypothetical protein